MNNQKVAVLCGGISPEREVSIVSGRHVAEALSNFFDTTLLRLDENRVPASLKGGEYVVYPAMHGDYGEDGTLQAELDTLGVEYAGSQSLSSRVCMVKPAAKALMKSAGVGVADEFVFDAAKKPDAASLLKALGQNIIIKPADKGSSVGLKRPKNADETAAALAEITEGLWMAESFFKGRELSVGVIGGKAAGIVEIKPEGGVYDFVRKYTAGKTVYEYPAKIDETQAAKIRASAEAAYAVCGCRDFARIDFILDSESGKYIALEINTLPGMTPTSLLPKSASCIGLDFDNLCKTLITQAIKRRL